MYKSSMATNPILKSTEHGAKQFFFLIYAHILQLKVQQHSWNHNQNNQKTSLRLQY